MYKYITCNGIIMVLYIILVIWFRLGIHYRAEEKYGKSLGKFRADKFLVEYIFILLSHINQGDN